MRDLITLCTAVLVAALAGCEPAIYNSENEAKTQTPADEHGHSHDPPHGGTIAEWGGGKYHVEFTVDHDKQESTVYVLGLDCKTAAPIGTEKLNLAIDDPKFQVELIAQPQSADGEGKSSRFVGKHESLGIVREFSGKIFGSIDGKAFTGNFTEIPHDH